MTEPTDELIAAMADAIEEADAAREPTYLSVATAAYIALRKALEPIDDRAAAIAELVDQIENTDPLNDSLVLLNAGGKCPAITGCGPTSDANAALIVESVNALPDLLTTIESLRAELAEARSDWLTSEETD